jgi:hypothetical protein
MLFITDDLAWGPQSGCCDLSHLRWDIEVFFK